MNIVNNIFNELMQKNEKKKKIEICEDSDLPKRGWIQGCYSCCIPTSHTYLYGNNIENKYFTFHAYICKDCKNMNILNDNNFKNKLNEYIMDYLYTG